MIRKAIMLGLIVLLLGAFLGPLAIQAQGGLEVLGTSTQAEFPAGLAFSIEARSNVNITDIRLHYTTDRSSFAQVTSEAFIEFEPATAVEADWTWDMRRTGGLPPGTVISYWWVMVDAEGNRVATSPEQVHFDDTRYPWQTMTDGNVTLHSYKGDNRFAGELMAAAREALDRLAADTGAVLERPVDIHIYADARALQGALIFAREWTGGIAFTRYGSIAIGIPPDELDWGKRAMSHELAHLVVHQMTFNPYNELPTWLNEGLAMYAEGSLEAPYVSLLQSAANAGVLLSVRSLTSPFSANPQLSALSYAQSFSFTDFLVDSYGQSRMLELLLTFREGSAYDAALEEVYGFDMDGLNAAWRDWLARPAPSGQKAEMPLELAGALAG